MGNANLDELWWSMELVMPKGYGLFLERESPKTISWSVFKDAGNGAKIADGTASSINLALLGIIESLTLLQKSKND